MGLFSKKKKEKKEKEKKKGKEKGSEQNRTESDPEKSAEEGGSVRQVEVAGAEGEAVSTPENGAMYNYGLYSPVDSSPGMSTPLAQNHFGFEPEVEAHEVEQSPVKGREEHVSIEELEEFAVGLAKKEQLVGVEANSLDSAFSAIPTGKTLPFDGESPAGTTHALVDAVRDLSLSDDLQKKLSPAQRAIVKHSPGVSPSRRSPSKKHREDDVAALLAQADYSMNARGHVGSPQQVDSTVGHLRAKIMKLKEELRVARQLVKHKGTKMEEEALSCLNFGKKDARAIQNAQKLAVLHEELSRVRSDCRKLRAVERKKGERIVHLIGEVERLSVLADGREREAVEQREKVEILHKLLASKEDRTRSLDSFRRKIISAVQAHEDSPAMFLRVVKEMVGKAMTNSSGREKRRNLNDSHVSLNPSRASGTIKRPSGHGAASRATHVGQPRLSLVNSSISVGPIESLVGNLDAIERAEREIEESLGLKMVDNSVKPRVVAVNLAQSTSNAGTDAKEGTGIQHVSQGSATVSSARNSSADVLPGIELLDEDVEVVAGGTHVHEELHAGGVPSTVGDEFSDVSSGTISDWEGRGDGDGLKELSGSLGSDVDNSDLLAVLEGGGTSRAIIDSDED